MKTILICLLVLAGLRAAYAQLHFRVNPGDSKNDVRFTSSAPMETVTGKTRNASGFLDLDPSGAGDGAHGEVHVDLASLRTGIDLRDKHMREDHLETSRYPEAIFTLSSLTLPSGGLPDDKRTRVSVKGTFKLHGVERSIDPETYLTLHRTSAGTSLKIESDFSVSLSDYQIKRPQFLLLRLAEEQHVHVELLAVSGSGVAADTH